MSGITEAAERACPDYVAEVLIGIERPINDDQYPVVEGIIGVNASLDFIREYEGSNRWLSTMKARYEDYGSLTIKQRRSVIESLRRSLRKEAGLPTGAKKNVAHDVTTASKREPAPAEKPPTKPRDGYDCFRCGQHFPNKDELYAHRKAAHGIEHKSSRGHRHFRRADGYHCFADGCDKVFATKAELYAHKDNEH